MSPLLVVIIGCLVTGIVVIITRVIIIKINNISTISKNIKLKLIEVLHEIENLDSNQNTDASIIVVTSINNFDLIIKQYCSFDFKSKAKKVSSHYNEYKQPYKENPLDVIGKFRGFPTKNNEIIKYKDEYFPHEYKDSRENAIQHLNNLINDLQHIITDRI